MPEQSGGHENLQNHTYRRNDPIAEERRRDGDRNMRRADADEQWNGYRNRGNNSYRRCNQRRYTQPRQNNNSFHHHAGHSYRNTHLGDNCSGSSKCSTDDFRTFGSRYHRDNEARPKNKNTPSQSTDIAAAFKADINQAESLRHQIESNTYECMVCYDTINAFCATYSCFQCFNIFHLVCIRQWASSKLCDNNLASDASVGWTCPVCQVISADLPIRYKCFCKSVINPEYKPFILPHSCGEKCSRIRESCSHSCPELCHPGKCPPCLMTVVCFCLCRKESKRLKCSKSSSSFNCENTCQKMLNCKRHRCQDDCHSGSCKDCPKTNDLICYCGKSSRIVICGTEIESNFLQHTGYWSCSEICDSPLSCGNHTCDKKCHPGPCPPCKTDVASINSCPCGKTRLEKISSVKRESCLDAIQTCMKVCRKLLTCGNSSQQHFCQSLCHNGPCPPCLDESLVTCACKSYSEVVACVNLEGRSLLCEKICHKKKSCGRHRCNTKCCLQDNHICMTPCNKILSCKSHKCEELCHKGPCMPCLMSNFDEVYCTCGKTKLDPPIACGTPPPTCHEICSRGHVCSHPVTHKCHYDDQCPPCPQLTNKVCMGGHKVRYDVPCHVNDVSCGALCQKQLPCEKHTCSKWCHKGSCVGDDEKCRLPCAEPRPTCLHPCNAACHPKSPCPSTICFSPIKISCDCKRRNIDLLCFNGSPKVSANSDLFSFMMKLKTAGISVSQTDLSDYLSCGAIQCDEQCKVEIRNQKLAEGLGLIDVPIDNVVAPSYPESLKRAVKEDKNFIVELESTFSDLIIKYKKRNDSLDSLNKVKFIYHDLKVMNKEKRKIVHELSSFYKIETQSFDSEPQRNVQVRVTHSSCEPILKLSQFFHKRVIGGVGSSNSKQQQPQQGKSDSLPNLQTLDLESLPKNDIVFDNWEDIH